MIGSRKYAEGEFGDIDYIPYTISTTLPGILGTDLFGQPLWPIFVRLYPGNVKTTIAGIAVIRDPAVLPNHSTLLVTGTAVIQR